MKRVVSMVLAVAILVGMLPTTAWATEMETVGGTCGENLSWTFDESSGSLKISGTGDMDDYSWSQMYDPTNESSDIWVTDAPWRDYYNAIKSIDIESDVTSVGDGAFRGCSAVTSISLSNDVEALGEYSFVDCDGIIDIVIPENVKTIGEAAFSDCNALESVSILGAASIGNFAFSECANLISVELPETLTSIGEYGFRGCEALRTVTIPSSVRTIGTFAFVWCESLNEICFEGSAPSMDGTILSGLTCNVSYPSDDETWSEELQKEFDDTITWNGNSSDEGTSGSSHSHSYGDWYETKAPTQEAEGEERRDCIDCDYYETRITEKLPVDEEPGNSCGENLTWELDTATGTLVISGTGTMDNSWWPYETPSESPNFAPWHDNAANIKSVVINSGVTSIGHFAFFDCVNLTNVSIPEGVTFIGCAFVGCDSLKELYIPASVTDFRYPSNEGVCTGLTKIVVDVGNSVYSSDEAGMLYNKDKTKFIGCPTGYQGAYTIADSVTEIGDWAFYACTGLTAVDVPTSVTTIGISAFNSCAKMDGIVIPEGVTTIGMFTFAYCAGLTEITIPKNVTALGNGVFTECTALAEVRFEGDAPDIDYECFNQTSTTAYYPAGNSTWTEDKLSNYCGNIQWVEYADNVNQCGDELFWEFDADTKTLTISGKGEMYDFPDAGSPWYSLNAEIDHVVISEGATSIGNYAFVSCGVDDIEIPDSVTRIGQGAFALSSIESIKIPSGVTTIEEYTFTRSSLNSVVLPEQLKVIEENAFAETPLTTVTLPETLTEIGAEAFWSTMLTSVAIPENVSLIGAGAFAWCEDLTSISVVASNANFVAKNGVLFDKNETTLIQYPAKKTQETYTVPAGMSVISAYAFSGAKALKKVVLSDNMKSLEKCAFIGCSGLTEMNIPENVSSFGLGLFDNCRDLKNITFTGDAPVFAEHWISEDMNLTAYYPADDETWADEVKQNYGGKITWVVSCDHSFGDWYETKAPTEEVEGEERRDCEKCDYYETRTKEKLCQTHNYVSVITEPTCTEQGYTTYTCDCGYSYVDNYIEPLGHNMGEWYEHTKPTNEERGEDRRNCENCTYYESRSIPSLSTTLIDSGECGKDLQWKLTSDGVLSITGTGPMTNWEYTYISPYGNWAPWNQYRLDIRTVDISSGVTSIGSYAFNSCINVTDIRIPASLEVMGKYAFGGGLRRNLYINDLTAWCKIDFKSRESAPLRTYGGNLYINGEKTEELIIPNGIAEIGNFSFSGIDFKSVKIPEGVSMIGGYAFASNDIRNTLEYVELPESLDVIKGWAFYGCGGLKNIVLPTNISTIDENAFCDTGLIDITVPGSVNTISAGAFSSCDNLENVVILNGVVSIDEEAFAFSDKLAHVVIPSSVTSIASDAFSYCKSLTKIELSNDNSSFTLKDGAVFSKNLGKLIIFPAMHNTSSFAIPDVTTTIADYAFQNSNNLKEVIIPDSITSIGTYAFSYSQNLASVTIPGTIEEIQYCTFAYSPGLIDVKIKSGIHTIGNWAFRECTNLRTVTIPRSVESIRDYAFYDCNSLSDVYYMGSEEEWGEIYIGSSNSCLLNANIHFNCEGPELEKNAEIRYFRKWDADTQTAYWGEDPPIVEELDLGSQVTEVTDKSFMDNVDDLLGTYVLVETKARTNGMIGPDILLSIKPVDTKIGMVTSADENTIVINGKTYATPDDLLFPDSYVGKTVRYYLYNGELISLEVRLPSNTAYDVVLNEYRDICSMTRDEYDSQYKESDYPYVNQLMMRYYHIYGGIQIVYAFYDIDNNGVAELLVGRGDEQSATIIGLYAFDGNAAVTLNNTAGERSSVKIYTDGTVFMGGALSASEYISKYYRFDASGYKLTEVSAGSMTEIQNFKWSLLEVSDDLDDECRIVIPSGQDSFKVENGQTLRIPCMLYKGDEPVADWDGPELSISSKDVSAVLYDRTEKNGETVEVIFKANAVGTAYVQLFDQTSDTELMITVVVSDGVPCSLSELDPADFLAFSSIAYHDFNAVHIGETIKSILDDVWELAWDGTNITYGELCADIAMWRMCDYSKNKNNGFYAVAFQNDANEIVIAYRGSIPLEWDNVGSDLWNDWFENDFPMIIFNEISEKNQIGDAFWMYSYIRDEFSPNEIVVTGHSLGGGLGNLVSARYGCRAETMNAISALDVMYYNGPDVFGENFAGVDLWNMQDHANEYDVLAGTFEEARGSLRIKPYIAYESKLGSGFKFQNHGLSSYVEKDSTGKISLTRAKYDFKPTTSISKQLFSKYLWGHSAIDLGTSSNDSFALGLVEPISRSSYGGEGDDKITTSIWDDTLVGGNGSDTLDGGRGNDKYIYFKGNGIDTIYDVAGLDKLYLYGFSENDEIEVIGERLDSSFIEVLCNGEVIVRIYKDNRSFSLVTLDSFTICKDISGYVYNEYDITSFFKEKEYDQRVLIACPVDIQIFDEVGNLVYTVKDGASGNYYTEYGNFYVFEEENGEFGKVLELVEGYSVRIVGVDNGTMDISHQKITNGELGEVKTLTDIPVSECFEATFEISADGELQLDDAESHIADLKWLSNATHHWHTCAGCDEKLDITAHSGGTATCTKKAVCTVCGASYGELASHDYETSWSQGDANGHWHECKNCSAHDTQVKHTPGAAATEDTAQFCTVCGYVITPALGHTCTAGSKWYSNGTYHWHVCTSCGAWVKTSYHSYSSDTDETCNVCGYTRTVTATEPTQETEVAMTETTEATDPGEEVIATETAPMTVPTEANENLSDDAVSEDTDSRGVSGVLITVFAIVALGSLAVLVILLVYKKRRKSK